VSARVSTDLEAPLVPRRALVLAGAAVALGIAAFVAYDLATETDEEHLEGYLDVISGEVDGGYADRVLAWIDPATAPFEAHYYGETRTFDAGNAAELAPLARTALGRWRGTSLTLLRSSIRVEGDDADVHAELLTSDGMVTVDLDLRRHDDGWLVVAATVR
jgi:hypothetical protein